MIGETLGHFRILGLLGEGGMGKVYRAADTRLGRDVAIKVLTEAVAADADRLARFEREARTLASLNHPGIATIYAFESARDASDPAGAPLHFLVMELVDGETLSERLSRGPLDVHGALRIARQVAEALDAAHGKGVVHRDLKPANVMLTRSGSVKVLDFGLARPTVGARADRDAATATQPVLTRRDQIVGTVPYMSPEQARGGALDTRSDLFSLGVMLFEMLAQRRPFEGDTAVDVISSILRDPVPDLAALRPAVPAALVDLVERTLAKSPEARFASAAELRDRLTAIETEGAARDAAPRRVDAGRDRALDARAVAVLPFANLSGTDEAEFLAAGLHNDLITELSRVPGLTVISRTSVMGYRDTAKPMPQIGRELGAGTIIEGAVQSAGRRVRLTAQLIDAASDVHRWAERYDHQISTDDLFDLQSELARRIIDSLRSMLAPDQEMPVGKRRTNNLEAYRLYTLGRVQFDRRTETGFRRAIEYFEQAVARDPDFVLAWVGLADAIIVMKDYGVAGDTELLPRAREAVARARALDPDSAEVHTSLGLLHSLDRDTPGTLREWALAIQLQPGYADVHNWMSWLHVLIGRATDALGHARRAVELNPLATESVSNLSLSLLVNGQLEESLAEARHAAELSPGWSTAAFYQGLALHQLERYTDARAALSGLTVEWAGRGAEAALALTLIALGEARTAREVLAGIDPEVDGFSVGLVELALGEIDAASERFARLDRVNSWGAIAIHHLYRDVWQLIRRDGRHDALVRLALESMGMTAGGSR